MIAGFRPLAALKILVASIFRFLWCINADPFYFEKLLKVDF